MKLPNLKKKINSFLVGEEGKISKQSLLKAGVFLGAAAVGTALIAKETNAGCPLTTTGEHTDHCNELSLNYKSSTATAIGTHNHATHTSHGNHGSHNSAW